MKTADAGIVPTGCVDRTGTPWTWAKQLRQPGDDCSGVDLVTLADQDLRDRTVALGGNRDLHLHRLQGHHRITRRDRVSGADMNGRHQTRQRTEYLSGHRFNPSP